MFVKSNFKDPRAEDKVIEFIEDGIAKYIELVTLLVKKSEVQVSEKILDCHITYALDYLLQLQNILK